MSVRPTRRQFIAGLAASGMVLSAAMLKSACRPESRILNVRSFGAVGDGRSNDTEAIVAALRSARPDGTVYFPAGSYRATQTISVPGRVTLMGDGSDASTIDYAGDGPIARVTGRTGVTIQDLEFRGNSNPPTYGAGIIAKSSDNLVIQRCRIRNIRQHAVFIQVGDQILIEDTEFHDIGFTGVRLGPTGDDSANQDITIRRCEFHSVVTRQVDGNSAIHAHGSPNTRTHNVNVTIEDCFIDSFRIGVGLDDIEHAIVRNCRIIGRLEYGEGIAFSGSNNVIEWNQINHFVAAGVLVWGISWKPNDNNIVRNNEIWDCAQGVGISTWYPGSAIDGIEISGNRCYRLNGTGTEGWGDMAYGVQAYADIHPDLDREVTDISVADIRVTGNDLRGTGVGPYAFDEPYRSATVFQSNIS